MGAILIYLLVVLFVVLPATVIYGLVIVATRHFTSTSLTLLGIGAGLIALAVVFFFAFGKRLVVK